MSQLKPSFLRDVKETLETSRFTAQDFEVSAPEAGRTLVKILFLHKPDYNISLKEQEKRDSVTIEQKYTLSSRIEHVTQTVYVVESSPGKFKLRDSEEIADPSYFLAKISSWCDSVRNDLYALSPKSDPLEDLRKKLDEHISSNIDDPSTYFDEEELDRVDSSFNDLYEQISGLQEQYSITTRQLAELQKEFAEFKASARAYPKGIWARITSNKLVRSAGGIMNSSEGRTFIFQQIRRALGQDGS